MVMQIAKIKVDNRRTIAQIGVIALAQQRYSPKDLKVKPPTKKKR
jgi:hypothetical protein